MERENKFLIKCAVIRVYFKCKIWIIIIDSILLTYSKNNTSSKNGIINIEKVVLTHMGSIKDYV